MATTQQNFTARRGQKKTITTTIVDDATGLPRDCTDVTALVWHAKHARNGSVYLEKQLGAGIAWVNQAGGVFRVTIDQGETSTMSEDAYDHCAAATKGSDGPFTVMAGSMALEDAC